MKNNFHRHLEGIYRSLKNRFDYINNAINHSLTQGEENEEEIRKLLIDFLPSNYGIGSGIIVDINGKSSKQIDIIIYDKSLPNYTLNADSKLFLVDQVIATIEIKTNFTSGEKSSLNSALENVKSINELTPSPKKWTDIHSFVEDEINHKLSILPCDPRLPITIVFFYSVAETKKAMDLNEFYKSVNTSLSNIEPKYHPDILFSLGHATFLKYDDVMLRQKPITKHTFLLLFDDESKRTISAGSDENCQALINFGNIEFKDTVAAKWVDIDDLNGKYHVRGIVGENINLDPLYYRTCKFDGELYYIDPFRAFINFLTLIELGFRLKRTNKNSFILNYFPSDYFKGSEPKK